MPMRDSNFDPVKFAKTELNPLIDELIAHADRDNASDQLTYFSGIRNAILNASNSGDLIEVFFNFVYTQA